MNSHTLFIFLEKNYCKIPVLRVNYDDGIKLNFTGNEDKSNG